MAHVGRSARGLEPRPVRGVSTRIHTTQLQPLRVPTGGSPLPLRPHSAINTGARPAAQSARAAGRRPLTTFVVSFGARTDAGRDAQRARDDGLVGVVFPAFVVFVDALAAGRARSAVQGDQLQERGQSVGGGDAAGDGWLGVGSEEGGEAGVDDVGGLGSRCTGVLGWGDGFPGGLFTGAWIAHFQAALQHRVCAHALRLVPKNTLEYKSKNQLTITILRYRLHQLGYKNEYNPSPTSTSLTRCNP